jgi:RND family efflux transporter MFP subunit
MRFALVLLSAVSLAYGASAEDFVIHASQVDDRKAVIATVEPVHLLAARARIGGTIIRLKVREGDLVASGAEVAVVVDQKLALQMQALDSRIRSQQAQRDQAKIDLDRAEELMRRGVGTQKQLDQARTAFDVAERTAAAMRADREVIVQQAAEGAVLAPGAGRVLTLPVSVGRVVLPGETIATLAEDNYILRLALPERHARFMRAGDAVLIGARGERAENGETMRQGKVRIVYPELRGGRVIADVDVEDLGNYFVGERTRVYLTTGKRDTIVAPRDYVYRRAGVNFVKLKDGTEVVVQPGETRPDGVEILSGLRDGDVVVRP